jgi:hypothetical protein
MLRINKADQEAIREKIQEGRIEGAALGRENFVDTIIKNMKERGVIDDLKHVVPDKRVDNARIPLELIWALGIDAKMKVKTSMTDIPYAIEDAQLLADFGCTLSDRERGLGKGLMDEGELRHLFGKYSKEELISGYNGCVQGHILPRMEVSPTIHLLDCTKVEVNLKNGRYEGSGVVREEEGFRRGYKLATLRGVAGDGGVIEEIRLGRINEHDLELSREMLRGSGALKAGDVLINDRGFLSRDMVNRLKRERGVDSYVPLKKNMRAYDEAVRLAKMEGTVWYKHPNKKRKGQKIAFVPGIGGMWKSERPEEDVPINSCVVWDEKEGEHYVFITTDTEKTARQIMLAYEMRPEIEEDYRQLKDFWRLEDFKSTKLTLITFHIVCTLLGYLLFQRYVGSEEGKRWAGQSLPVIVKTWERKRGSPASPSSVIVYSGENFGIFAFVEFIRLYATLPANIRLQLDGILSLV